MCPCLPSFFAAVLYPSCASTTIHALLHHVPQLLTMMDDEQLDMPEDWLTAGTAAGGLGAQMARFEAHLRCPICARFLETAMAAECGCVAGGLGGGRGRDLTKALVYGCFQSSTTGPDDDLAHHLKSIALAVACGSCASAACVWRRC